MVLWAGSLPKQQPEPLQRSLSQELLQVVFQETEPTSVLQPTPLQQPVADLGFLNGGNCRRHEDRGGAGAEGIWKGGGVLWSILTPCS